MYKSRKQIEKKIAQSEFLYKQIKKFQNRIFVNGGIDKETGARPLLTYLSSFLSSTRSILQYSCKEAKETNQLEKYQKYVNERPIFKFFKDIRDSDIHEYTIGSIVNISSVVNIDPSSSDSKSFKTDWVSFNVEELSDIDSPKVNNDHLNITTTLSIKIEITDGLIKQFEKDGKRDLVEAANKGEEIYKEMEFEKERDLFILCERYMAELKDFVAIGISKGFIS